MDVEFLIRRGGVLVGFLAFISSFSCEERGPEFHELDKGISFRRVLLGEGQKKIHLGEGVGVFYRVTAPDRPEKSFLKDSSWFLLDQPEGVWTRMLESMAKGDSSIFLLSRKGLEGGGLQFDHKEIPDSLGTVRLEVRVLDHRKPSKLMEWKLEREGKELLDQERWKEWERIRDFVKKVTDTAEPHFVEGIYMIPVQKGKGPRVKVGSEIAVHYKGFLPDSTVFDDSYKRGEPLRFRFGDPKQVVRGMGIGLKYMREGGKAKLVIPSYLAFGKKGGRTGILPPHTFVFYEIEVLKVQPS